MRNERKNVAARFVAGPYGAERVLFALRRVEGANACPGRRKDLVVSERERGGTRNIEHALQEGLLPSVPTLPLRRMAYLWTRQKSSSCSGCVWRLAVVPTSSPAGRHPQHSLARCETPCMVF